MDVNIAAIKHAILIYATLYTVACLLIGAAIGYFIRSRRK